MEIEKLSLEGVMLVYLDRHEDERGQFTELISENLSSLLGVGEFPQVNHSNSLPNVFRGMHLQLAPHGQGKLVFCVRGSVTDFILDVTPGSKSFGQSVSVQLSEDSPLAILIPSQYAHGFLAGENGAQVVYAVTDKRSVQHEISINYKSTSVAKKMQGVHPILSTKDKSAMSLDAFSSQYVRLTEGLN